MKMNARMGLRIVALVIVVGVLAWNFLGKRHRASVPGDGASAASAPAAASTASAKSVKPVEPASPATMKMGRLTLTACELKQPDSGATTAAFCAKFPVPENRADPKSRRIDLKLAILKSSSQVPDKDLVVPLAGGPGQSMIESYPGVAPALAPLRKRHDLLLLDQRGTGASNALKCPDVEKKLDTPGKSPDTVAEIPAFLRQCAQEVEKFADPRDYTTTASVADLEAVREALGAPKLDILGFSYGTRLAQHYAQAHPDAVRSIVLDGVVPNQLVLGESFAGTLQRSLKLQAAACSAAPSCKQAFGDWYATLHQLYNKLKTQPPQPVTFEDPTTFKPVTRDLTADRLAGLARFFSYSAVTQALLPLAVEQAAKGNYAPLMAQSHLVVGGVDKSISGQMQWSVLCTEDAPLLKPRPKDADTLLGNQLIEGFIAGCKVWPHAPMPANFHAPFKSSIPTLLISGERDPVTPPAFADEVLKGLSDGRALVVEGMGHVEAINAGCMPNLVGQFIDKLEPKKLDTACLKRIGPIPAFVTFNGAAP